MAELTLRGAASINAAALRSLKHHSGPKSEPHLVAAIFRDGRFRKAIVDAVQPRWRAVAVRTVFVHLTPKVRFSCAKGPCELGDALVIYREQLGVGQRRTQAVLFQAKMWKGPGRGWVKTNPDQHALYRHWPPFKLEGGPAREILLPPGDYGRVLGLVASSKAEDVPRVSPRRPTAPGCLREDNPWSETMGTLGRGLRGLVRFEVGEQVEGDWAVAVDDIVKRVGPASAGGTFPPGPRGGVIASVTSGQTSPDAEAPGEAGFASELDALLNGASDLPPEDEVTFKDGDRPLAILLIDFAERG